MVRYGYVVDLDKCMGCRACVVACKTENNTGRGVFWMHVFRTVEGEYPNAKLTFLPRPCMHCDNPPCAKVCPVGARFKREDGFVLTDFDTCIGCRYCEVACPYGVNFFNWKDPKKNEYYEWDGKNPMSNPDHEKMYDGRNVSGGGHYKGVMEKCTWCVHRVEKGQKPACVANCPVNALLFGDLDDPESDVSTAIRDKGSFRLLDELGTHPRVYYIGRHPPTAHAQKIEFIRRV